MKRFTKSLATLACAGLLMGAAMVATSQPASTTKPTTGPATTGTATTGTAATGPATTQAGGTVFDADFAKDLGEWTIAGAEGKLVAGEGVKFTDLKTVGGLLQERQPRNAVDLSATPKVTIQMENAGSEDIEMHFKVKTDKKAYTKDFKVAPGKYTLSFDLADATDVDVKKVDYMKLFGQGEVNLVVKKVKLSK